MTHVNIHGHAARFEYELSRPPSRVLQTTLLVLIDLIGCGGFSQADGR